MPVALNAQPMRLPIRPARREIACVSKHLHKHVGIISLLTAVSRVLGMVRDSLALAIFGGPERIFLNDAFLTAFNLPNLVRRLLGEGALTAALVPTLQEELREGGESGAFTLLNQVTSWLLVVTGTIVGMATLGFSQSRLLPGHEDKWYLAADLTALMFPYLAFICLAAAFNATLNVLGRFTEPALSPIWLNVCMIASLGGAGLHFAATPLGEVRWLCAGVLAGGFFQMMVPAAVLMRAGWRPRFSLTAVPRVRQIAALMLPSVFGTAIYQINTFVSRLLAFSLVASTATLLYNANRLMELPIGVFAIAVTTVVYPLIARHAVERNFAALGEDFRRGLRLILIINVPAAAGLALLGGPICRLIYQHHNASPDMVEHLASLLTLFVIGLPFFSVVNLTVRVFYALKDTVTPVKIALADFAINLGLSLLLMRPLGASGLVLASTTAIIVQAFLLQGTLARRIPELKFAPLWRDVAKVAFATLTMSLLVWAGWKIITIALPGRRLADVLAVGGLIPIAVAAYAWQLTLLRVEGYDAIVARLRKKRAD